MNGLIESVYHPERVAGLAASGPAWSSYLRESEGRQLGKQIVANNILIDFKNESYMGNANRFQDATELSIRTRLGDDRVVVDLSEPLPSVFVDDTVSQFSLPAYLGSEIEEPCLWTQDGNDYVIHLPKREVRYSKRGFEW